MNIPKPADSTWTDDQWNAIVSTGQDILWQRLRALVKPLCSLNE